MFAPRVKSKLSTLSYNSVDLEGSSAKSPSLPSEPFDTAVDAPNQKHGINKLTVSRLSFPFVKSSKSPSPRAVKQLPSSLSNASSLPRIPLLTSYPKQDVGLHPRSPPSTETPPLSYQPDPRRHEYCHRGYSRHALAHIKWFWVTREDEWETRFGPVRLSKPQLDESFLETALDDPLATAGPSVFRRRTPLHPVHQSQHELPPMTIHPRRGDLSSLRDPYCIRVDRSFVVLPTWTIGKTLWMYDVHLASRDRASVEVQTNDMTDPYDDTESESESLGACSSSAGYNGDSDATLVDSETENDLSLGGSSSDILWDPCVDGKQCMSYRDTYSSTGSATSSGLSDSFFSLSLESAWSRSAYSEPSTPKRTCEASNSEACHSWAKDWYQRWQCMIEVLNRQRSYEGKHSLIGQDDDDALDYFPRHNISHPSTSSGLHMPEMTPISANRI